MYIIFSVRNINFFSLNLPRWTLENEFKNICFKKTETEKSWILKTVYVSIYLE